MEVKETVTKLMKESAINCGRVCFQHKKKKKGNTFLSVSYDYVFSEFLAFTTNGYNAKLSGYYFCMNANI